MNRIRSWVRAFFGFSRSETNAFLILLPLMVVIVFVVPGYKTFYPYQGKDYTLEKKQLDSLIGQWKTEPRKDSSTLSSKKVFSFNPNEATKEELISLGFAPNVAVRLENYRNKGGKFNIKSDLLKIYGIDTSLYASLYQWIALPTEKPEKKHEEKIASQKVTVPAKEKFDLNIADSAQLISIYGIGATLSTRIIKYRHQLGGFISTEQLKEIYGLDSAVIRELKTKSFISDNFLPRSIDINFASQKELAAHPYIKYTIAKAITAYRFQHGKFNSIDDLSKIAIIDLATFEKIRPYLSLNQ